MLNIAIIGCGYWSPNLIRNFNAIPEVNIKTVCDKNQQRLMHINEIYPDLEITTDLNQVLDDDEIEAVVIATPVSTHYKLAKTCLLAGKHTFIEKPMASHGWECRELINIADEKSLSLMVGHVFVYTPSVKKIKELIKTDEIGEVFYMSARRYNLGLYQPDINVAWDLAPHDISIILFLLEENPISVNCQGRGHINPKIEDITNISLYFKSGKFATIQSSWIDPRKVRDITIVGSKKMVEYDDTEPLEKIKVYDKCVSLPPYYDTQSNYHHPFHYGDIYIPYLKQYEPLRAECQDFIDLIKTGKKSFNCGEKGLEIVQILEAAELSLKLGGASVDIKLNDKENVYYEEEYYRYG